MRPIVLRVAMVLLALYLVLLGGLTFAMRQPPEVFAGVMARAPSAVFLLFPFETLWRWSRAGQLQVGYPAPDFELSAWDRSSRVRLSSFRGEKPVVLVFGSYT